MDEQLLKRLRAAVVAAWWTILIAGCWLLVGWFVFLLFLGFKPDWMLKLWGGGELDWPEVHSLVIWFFAVFKLIMFVAMMAAIWLTLWYRGLKRG